MQRDLAHEVRPGHYRLSVIFLALLIVAAVSQRAGFAEAPDPGTLCEFSAADRSWLSGTMHAWHQMHDEIQGLGDVDDFHAVFFDDACVMTSADALTERSEATWRAYPHEGYVILPGGETMQASITSFTSAGDDDASS